MALTTCSGVNERRWQRCIFTSAFSTHLSQHSQQHVHSRPDKSHPLQLGLMKSQCVKSTSSRCSDLAIAQTQPVAVALDLAFTWQPLGNLYYHCLFFLKQIRKHELRADEEKGMAKFDGRRDVRFKSRTQRLTLGDTIY